MAGKLRWMGGYIYYGVMLYKAATWKKKKFRGRIYGLAQPVDYHIRNLDRLHR